MRAFIAYLLFLCVFPAKCQEATFYWRDIDVDGRIPSDAFQVDTDVYIGQTGLSIDDMCCGTLTPGQTSLETACATYDVQNITYLIQIMCTKLPQDYVWLRTSAATFENDVVNKFPIRGGWDSKQNFHSYYIGRISVDGKFVIGNIGQRESVTGSQPLYYAYNGTDYEEMDSFEVLIYSPSLKYF